MKLPLNPLWDSGETERRKSVGRRQRIRPQEQKAARKVLCDGPHANRKHGREIVSSQERADPVRSNAGLAQPPPDRLKRPVELCGRRVPDAFRLIASLFARVQLAGYESLRIGKYSRGMVQRLGIAQALIGDPQLLIFDEPTSGLDPAGRKEVLDLVRSLKDAGKTVFFSSHILPEVEQICDRVVIIDRGRLVRSGRLDEIVRAGSRVEIIVDRLPEDAGRAAVEQGAEIEAKNGHGIRVLVEPARQREMMEYLWAAGCEIVRVNPVEESLEQVFLKLVGGGS